MNWLIWFALSVLAFIVAMPLAICIGYVVVVWYLFKLCRYVSRKFNVPD